MGTGRQLLHPRVPIDINAIEPRSNPSSESLQHGMNAVAEVRILGLGLDTKGEVMSVNR